MSKLLISLNSDSTLITTIDLLNQEWSSLLPENVPSFKMEEMIRECKAFPDGIFPGSEKYTEDKQITRIYKFPNYIEFSKILSDEVFPISDNLYLTTKFYDRRKDGWACDKIIKKVFQEEDVIGYCLNGDVYCKTDKNKVYKVFYGMVYKSLIDKNQAFIKLQKMLKDGVCLCLINGEQEFMEYFKDVIIESVKSSLP